MITIDTFAHSGSARLRLFVASGTDGYRAVFLSNVQMDEIMDYPGAPVTKAQADCIFLLVSVSSILAEATRRKSLVCC